MTDHTWEDGRWWRVISDDGTELWCETSDEKEARAALKSYKRRHAEKTAHLEHHQHCTAERWRQVK